LRAFNFAIMDAMNSHSNRRAFVSGSIAALAASSLRAAPEQREIRTAFIGIGHRGTALTGQVLKQENVRIAAICDIDPKARDAALTLTSRDNPRSFTEYRQVLDLKDVDAVIVATPCYLHAEIASACLDAGKYVYCEKPLGITPEQVQMALSAARRSKVFLQIGQQLRYMPGLREVIRQIQKDGVLGQTFVIKAQRHSTPVRPEAENARPAWYKDVRLSGDLIVENAIHNIDVCNWVADSRPQSVFGHGKKYFPKPTAAGTVMMDGFSVEYVYDNDIHLDYSQLYLHPRSLKSLANNQWYIVFGEKGAIDLSKGLLYQHGSDEVRELIAPAVRDADENAMSEFYACIREGRKPVADVTVAAVAALTTIMGREAIYQRRMVTWKELGVTV
jgi:myo-inositol 2-dehydrogenase/D-chiro-inositol 1-dehydrogenase